MDFIPTIGLEIHAELKTKTKMFCFSANDPNEHHPNINVCPICMGHPGTLPTINQEAVKHVFRLGLALEGEVAGYSRFDRKNYFYPDLPKGYQISQYQHPLVVGGSLQLPYGNNVVKIQRVHLEEDTGRLVHNPKNNETLVDFNRAGVPLMELVTEPDMHSAKEARAFAEEFQLILRYLGISDADMEKGQMRVEANVSLGKPHLETKFPSSLGNLVSKLGVKVEIKNLNSFHSVENAIDYEIKRQSGFLKDGKKIIQETRGWDEDKQKTVSQRTKEEAHDYRYFPEPDLPPLKPKEIFDLGDLRASLPELPRAKRERFRKEYQLDDKLIEVFIKDKSLSAFFEEAVSELYSWFGDKEDIAAAKLAANYLSSDLLGLLKEKETDIKDALINPEKFAHLVAMIKKSEISSRAAKDVLKIMFEAGEDPSEIVKNLGLSQISEVGELENAVQAVIKENPQAVTDYKKGKESALQFLIGQIMKRTKGKANPEIARRLLTKMLK